MHVDPLQNNISSCQRFVKKVGIVLVFSLISVPPYLSYFNVSNGFNVGDVLILLCTFICLVSVKSLSPIVLLPFSLALISLFSLSVNFVAAEYDLANAQKIFKWFYFTLLVFTVGSLCNSQKNKKLILNGIYIGLIISMVLTWYTWLGKPTYLGSVPMLHSTDQSGISLNRNYIGFFSSIAASLAAAFWVANVSRFVKSIHGVVLVFLLVTSLLTFSKGAWLATSLGVFSVLYSSRKVSLGKLTFILIAFLVVLLSISNLGGEILSRVLDRIEGSGGTNHHRLLFVVESVHLFANNLLFGVGPGGYRDAALSLGFEPTSDPHNALLWVAAEMGVFGALIVLLTFLLCFCSSRWLMRQDIVFIGYFAVVISLILNIPFHGSPVSAKYLWIVLGAVSVSYVRELRRKVVQFDKVEECA